MDTERAGKILEAHGISKSAFGMMLGVKASTARMAFSLKRFSKKMVAKLEELESELLVEQELGEVDEMIETAQQERAVIKAGMIAQSMEGIVSAKVYMLPKNPYLRFIEFSDGSHGKFRAKPGEFGLGSVVKVKQEDGDMYCLVGEYDRKGRLCG